MRATRYPITHWDFFYRVGENGLTTPSHRRNNVFLHDTLASRVPPVLFHNVNNVFRPIAKGVPVAFYSGEVLTAEQLDDRYPGFEGSDYVMQLGPDRYLDARDPEKSSIARWDSRPFTMCGGGWLGWGCSSGLVRKWWYLCGCGGDDIVVAVGGTGVAG